MKSLQKKLVCLQTPMKMERYHITLKNNNYLNMKLALKITVLLFLTQFSFSQEKTCEYEIDILTDQEETEKRQSEFKIKTKRFIESLEIDEMMAQLLVLEGFSTIKEIDGAPLEEITKIDGFDAETANELKERAKEYLETESKEISNRVKELGIQEDLMNHPGLSLGMLLTLGEKNIKTLADFADLSVDEILGGYDEVKGKRVEFEGILQNFDIVRAEAERLIMSAREKVFNK